MNRLRVTLLMLANASLAFFLSWSGDKIDDTFIAGALYALALAILALLLALRPRGFVLLLARGVSIAIIVIVVGLALITGAAFALGSSIRAWREGAVALALLAIQVFLLRTIPLSDANRPRRIFETMLGTGLAFVLTFVIYFAALLAANVAKFAMLAPRIRADSVMRS